MLNDSPAEDSALNVAHEWCRAKGPGWAVTANLGKGGTAPVFEVSTPRGPRALKIYDIEFSCGRKGEIESKRIDQQLELGDHGCPYLVRTYEGGRFEERLFLLMSRAEGSELEKCLSTIPRSKIRTIVDQAARAAIFLREHDLCHRDIKAANIFISDDYERCTLLDISVVRNVSDPLGIGTDHDGQLPVVATARYSPPEYLFRLLEPGPELWHALNIYQLGALLHDLIMRESLFQSEYRQSAMNRYRFAWVVATTSPRVTATDVDRDLLLIAQRALDKNWKRRAALGLEDFLADPAVLKNHALQFLGVGANAASLAPPTTISIGIHRVNELAQSLDEGVVSYLRSQGITPKHLQGHGNDDASKALTFSWTVDWDGAQQLLVEFRLNLSLQLETPLRIGLSTWLRLVGNVGKVVDQETIELPETDDHPGVEPLLRDHAVAAFESLAMKLMRRQPMG